MRPPRGTRVALAAGLLLVLALLMPSARAAQVAQVTPAGPTNTVDQQHSGAPTTAGADAQYVPAGCQDVPKSTGGEVYAQCYSMVRATADHLVQANAMAPPPSALGPADIQDAYNLPDAGAGQTVAIVDAFGYTNAEDDLAVFRAEYGLPPCTTDNGCFTKVDQRGGTDYPEENAGWALETALDLDAVSSACPKCHILLVEADSANVLDLGAAVDTAVALGADFVSNSYGVDGGFPIPAADHFYDHPGVALTVSSGDTGNVVSWPSTIPTVVSVGGTTLTRDESGRGWHETVWGSSFGGDGAGSGCSPRLPKPDYQIALDTQCDNRATADISAVADPATGLAVYDTLGQNGWLQVGGTSLASPLVAAMYALAGTPEPDTYPVTYPYHERAHLFDVTEGANGGCGNVLCQGGPGWDGPTGLGTPNGVAALRSGPHGNIAGTVTDAETGDPVAGATVAASPGGYATTTDADGHYQLNGVGTGSYQLTVSKYGYQDATASGIQVEDGQTTTADFALTSLPSATLSGTVTDGSGHGWPLYAKITIDGYPGGPVYTDPFTGDYQVSLVQSDSYTLHVTALAHGYESAQADVPFASGDVTRDVALRIDQDVCTAAGYDWNGLTEAFTGWKRSRPRHHWTVSGSRTGWSFDNPGDRPPVPGGSDSMAVADSGALGRHGRMRTTLTSPTVDLRGQDAPQLRFDTAYYALGDRQVGRVGLSVDGGRHWLNVWRASDRNAIGHIQLPIPQAAGHADVRVRFQYKGRYGWYWALDNVFVGTHTCIPVGGGLVTGLVTDADTGADLPGATVSGGGGSARSLATPDDPNAADGVYRLFAPRTGDRELTASAPGYNAATATVTVADGGVVRQDWSLTPAGG